MTACCQHAWVEGGPAVMADHVVRGFLCVRCGLRRDERMPAEWQPPAGWHPGGTPADPAPDWTLPLLVEQPETVCPECGGAGLLAHRSATYCRVCGVST